VTTLKVVSSNIPDPPYPEDTQTKGWRFELDMPRIRRSDTWVLANPDMRPWLLMLWATAFEQVPAGSLPNSPELIAAHIGMDARTFKAHSDMLLRGFESRSDGRLYHPVVVGRVEAILAFREQERTRKQNYRERMSHGTGAGQTRTSGGVPTLELEQELEQKEKEQETCELQAEKPARTSRSAPVPFQKILDLWAEVLPELPQPAKLSDSRKAQIRARWHDELPDLDAWRECFQIIRKSKFLMGKVPPQPGYKPFRATLAWVVKEENLLKIYEGNYDG